MFIFGVDLLPSSTSCECLFAKAPFQSLSYFLVNPKIQTAFSRDAFGVSSRL